jgi:glycosyltransferase involved in cell wall biosynthesis
MLFRVILLIDIVLVKPDPIMSQGSIRAELIVKSLRKKYSVLALGWDRGEGVPNKSNLLDVFRWSAPYGYTLRYLALLPVFWTWIFIKLCAYRPKIIHACNLDTIIPCYAYKLLFRKKLIFDIHDRYAMTFIQRSRGFFFKNLYLVVNFVEENFANNADLVILVYGKILKTFKKKPRNWIAIMVFPEDHMTNYSKVMSNDFKLLFTGHVRRGRGLDKLLGIIGDMKNIELLVMGRIEDKNLLKKIHKTSNSKYVGFLDHKQLIDLELSANASIALYDLNLETQHEYGMANKILEAMMCGLPVITNIAHEIIKETGCGILVDYENVKQIKEAIISLRDNPELCTKLGENGRRAFLEKYNWMIMEEKLLKSYESLFSGIH